MPRSREAVSTCPAATPTPTVLLTAAVPVPDSFSPADAAVLPLLSSCQSYSRGSHEAPIWDEEGGRPGPNHPGCLVEPGKSWRCVSMPLSKFCSDTASLPEGTFRNELPLSVALVEGPQN